MLPETEAVAGIIKANATDVYKDSAQPAVRVLGKSLAQCVSLFATPVGRMAEIFEKNIHRYLNKLEGLKEEQIIPPDARVLAPIIEKMRFTEEEKVADYYAQILATASTKEHTRKVMVTFIEILNRLTADEIKILEYINSPSNSIDVPNLTEEERSRYGLQEGVTELSLVNSLPVIDINLRIDGQVGYRTLMKNFNCLSEKVSLDTPSNIRSYLDNMISLGLLERKFSHVFALEKVYDHLEKHEAIIEIRKDLNEKQKLDFDRSRIDVTDLGIKLLELCAPQK